MNVEILLRGFVVLSACLNLDAGFGDDYLHLTDATDIDDYYVGMELRIDGEFVGCVHDYESETMRVEFGEC